MATRAERIAKATTPITVDLDGVPITAVPWGPAPRPVRAETGWRAYGPTAPTGKYQWVVPVEPVDAAWLHTGALLVCEAADGTYTAINAKLTLAARNWNAPETYKLVYAGGVPQLLGRTLADLAA